MDDGDLQTPYVKQEDGPPSPYGGRDPDLPAFTIDMWETQNIGLYTSYMAVGLVDSLVYPTLSLARAVTQTLNLTITRTLN